MASSSTSASVLWQFYAVANPTDTHAKCNFCKKLISRGGKTPKDFGTTGMRNHLRGHTAEFARFEELAKMADKEREKQKLSTKPKTQ